MLLLHEVKVLVVSSMLSCILPGKYWTCLGVKSWYSGAMKSGVILISKRGPSILVAPVTLMASGHVLKYYWTAVSRPNETRSPRPPNSLKNRVC